MPTSKNLPRDHRPFPRYALSVLVVILGLIVSIFVASPLRTTTQDTVTNSQVPVSEQPVLGELGAIDPLVLRDGSGILTLVESPDPGFLEVGVRLTGPRSQGLQIGNIYLETNKGRKFNAAESFVDGPAVVFTINAELGEGETISLIWLEEGQELVRLS